MRGIVHDLILHLLTRIQQGAKGYPVNNDFSIVLQSVEFINGGNAELVNAYIILKRLPTIRFSAVEVVIDRRKNLQLFEKKDTIASL